MEIIFRELEVIKTDTGFMMPIFKDSFFEYDIKMAYVTSIGPGTQKGPILHYKRFGYLTAINGCIQIGYCKDGKTVEYKFLNKDKQIAAFIDPGIPVSYRNIADEPAMILNLANPCWTKEDPDTVKFDSWSDYFAKIKR